MARFLCVSALVVLSMTAASAQTDYLARARALHKQALLIDGHNDYPWALREKDPARDLNTLDIAKPQPGIMTDIARLKSGGVGGQFWSVYVPVTLQGQSAVTATLEQIDIVHRMVRKYPETFELALTAADIERIHKAGKIASLIGMEGGHSIDNSLANLRMFHRLGARYMTITHSTNTPWADASTDTAKVGGLSAFGEEVIKEMNWLGMLVDLSHVAPETMEDALRVTQAPVIFSHSVARALNDHPRNVPDNVLKLLPKNGGVIMVTFVPGFVSPKVNAWNKLQTAEQDRLKARSADTASIKAGLDKWTAANRAPDATIADVADHIDHIRKVAGVDAIGIGSDFDGISQTVKDLDNVSTYPRLTAELLRRGYTDADVRKILGLNVLRAMRGAEAVAKRLQKERGPSVAVIDTPVSPGTAIQEPIEIAIERTICYGTCPAYSVTMRGDGSVTYSGGQHTRVGGNRTWKIDPAVVRALAKEMESKGYFELKNDYEAMVTDNPTTYTTLTIGSRTKKIKDYVAGPRELKDMQRRIDEVSGAKQYVFISGAVIREMQAKGWRATGNDAKDWMRLAMYGPDIDVISALLAAGFDAKATDNGETLLMRAAAIGYAETVRLLLAAGADPTARDRNGRNAADRARDGLASTRPGPAREYALILKLLTDEKSI
jgi:membrane dipeptidase